MTWSAGTYTRPGGSIAWAEDRDAGTEIEAGLHDTHDEDLAQGINACLHKGGQNAATADISIGGNNLNNVADPTTAQQAATKAYVDTGRVADYDSPADATISTTEFARSTLTLAIPSEWNTYDVELLATVVIDETGVATGETQVECFFRETSVAGAAISSNTVVVGQDAYNTLPMSVFGYQQGETTTGSRTFVFTNQAGGNSGGFSMIRGEVKAVAYRKT